MNNIKRRRLDLKLSQKELGKLLGVKPNTISQYEQNLRYPRPSTARKLAKALNLTVDEIYQSVDKNSN